MSFETVASYSGQWKVTGIKRRPTHQNWVSGEVRLQTNQKSWRCALTVGANPRCDPYTYYLSREMVDFCHKLRILINLKDGVTIHVRGITDLENNDLVSKLTQIHEATAAGKFEYSSHKQRSPFACREQNSVHHQASPPAEFTNAASRMKDSSMTRRERMQAEAREDALRQKKQEGSVQGAAPSRDVTTKTPNKFLDNGRRKSEGALSGVSTGSFYSGGASRMYSPASVLSNKPRRSPGLMPLHPERQRPKFSELSNKSPTYTWSSRTPASPSPRNTSLQGFSNLGNTCYMNAILQSLFGLDTFSTDLMYATSRYNKHVPLEQRKSYLSFMLSRLLQAKKKEIASVDHKKQLLAQVKRTISSTARRFSGHEQHDAHEFLGQILDQLKDEVHKLTKEHCLTDTPAVNGHVEEIGSTSDQPAGGSTHDDLPNPTRDNFEFKVSHEITCLECYERLETLETFHDLSIDMPPRKALEPTRTIQDALDHFFLPEEVEYTCEQCGAKQAKVQHKFVTLPRVLILHLKRYAFNSITSSNTKLGQSIMIPKYLTLKDQCMEHTQPAPAGHLPYNFTKGDNIGLHVVRPFTPSSASKLPKSRLMPALTSDLDLDVSPEGRRNSTSRRKLDLGGEESTREEAEEQSNGPDARSTTAEQPEQSQDSIDWVLKLSKETASKESKSRERIDSLTMQTMSEDEMIKLALERSIQETSGGTVTAEGSTGGEGIPTEGSTGGEGIRTPANTEQVAADSNKTHSAQDLETSQTRQGGPDPSPSLSTAESTSAPSSSLSTAESTSAPSSSLSTAESTSAPSSELPGTAESTSAPRVPHHIKCNEHLDMDITVANSHKGEPPAKRSRLDDHSDSAYSSFTEDSTEEKHSAKKERSQTELGSHRGGEGNNEKSQQISGNKPVHIDLSLSDEENKENYTPVRSPNQEASKASTKEGTADDKDCIKLLKDEDFDEEAQLRQAIENSLKDQEQLGQQQDVELEKAKELSLQDNTPGKLFDNPSRPVTWSLKRTKEEERRLSRQAEEGDLPYSYQLVSVVSHLGSSSTLGHYISDVYDPHKRAWLSWDDSHMNRILEEDVRKNRERTGYIFFYVCKDTVQELEDFYYQERHHSRSQSLNSVLPVKKMVILPGSASKAPKVHIIPGANSSSSH